MHIISGCILVEGVDGLSWGGRTYSLLSQLTGTLVFAVAEEFDNTTLVWCKSRTEEALAIDPA